MSGRAGKLRTTIAKLNTFCPTPAILQKSAARSTRNTSQMIQFAATVTGELTARASITTRGTVATAATITAASIHFSAFSSLMPSTQCLLHYPAPRTLGEHAATYG